MFCNLNEEQSAVLADELSAGRVLRSLASGDAEDRPAQWRVLNFRDGTSLFVDVFGRIRERVEA